MQYFLYILAIPFLYINYKIVISDLKNKIIPNKLLKYLLLLIPFYYIYIFLNFPEINYLLFLGQIVLTFIVSFILYYFGVWVAGDAKYLLVLSLFIPYIGIIPFIGNIALITIFYLLGYFVYFYFGKLVFNKIYRQSLWKNIKQDLTESWKVYKGNKGGHTYKIVIKFLLIFLIVFVSIRLSRIYLFKEFFESGNSISYFSDIIQKYNIYLIFLAIFLFIGSLYLFRLIINKIKKYISKKFKLDLNFIGNILISILFILLISFIGYEYYLNSAEISNLLFRIFTIYLSIYLIFKILIYSYKITFGIAEYKLIDIKDLKEGDVVDKENLITMFGNQLALGFVDDINSTKESNKSKILFPSPKNYFHSIENKINKNTSIIIKKCFKITNNWHIKNKTPNFIKNTTIKIINTFSFAPYILFGFIFAFIFQDKLFNYLINGIGDLIKSFY